MSSTVVIQAPQSTFNPNAPKYKCCCNCCHVTTGTLVIGILEAISMALDVIGLFAGGLFVTKFTADLIISFAVICLYFAILVCLFVGLKRHTAGCLMPHLVVQALGIVVLAIALIAFIILLIVSQKLVMGIINEFYDRSGSTDELTGVLESSKDVTGSLFMIVAVVGSITLLIALIFSIWWFVVVLNCYRYFRDKAAAGYQPYAQQGMMLQTVPPAGGQPQFAVQYGGPPQGYNQKYPTQQTGPTGYTETAPLYKASAPPSDM